MYLPMEKVKGYIYHEHEYDSASHYDIITVYRKGKLFGLIPYKITDTYKFKRRMERRAEGIFTVSHKYADDILEQLDAINAGLWTMIDAETYKTLQDMHPEEFI